MIALDTNVLVRYLVQDDGKQAQAARDLIETLGPGRSGFVSREVILELVWVLGGSYGLSRDRIATTLENLVGSEELLVEAAEDVVRAANAMRHGGAEFSDRMILAAANRLGADAVYTFDQDFAQLPKVAVIQTRPA